jgi:hypothetical protein
MIKRRAVPSAGILTEWAIRCGLPVNEWRGLGGYDPIPRELVCESGGQCESDIIQSRRSLDHIHRRIRKCAIAIEDAATRFVKAVTSETARLLQSDDEPDAGPERR